MTATTRLKNIVTRRDQHGRAVKGKFIRSHSVGFKSILEECDIDHVSA